MSFLHNSQDLTQLNRQKEQLAWQRLAGLVGAHRQELTTPIFDLFKLATLLTGQWPFSKSPIVAPLENRDNKRRVGFRNNSPPRTG